VSVTQKDIARALNMSQSMVAGVLGNRKDVWASPEKRKLIFEQAESMGYRPNTAARRLRRGTSESVGLFVLHPPGASWNEYGNVVTILAQFLNARGYELNLKTFSDPDALFEGLGETARAGLCDVFILCASATEMKRQAALLEELKVPYIILGSLDDPESTAPQVDFDHNWLMERCVAHVAARGHSRIAYFGHDTQEYYARHLREGFNIALQKTFGQSCPEEFYGLTDKDRGKEAETAALGWMTLPVDKQPTAIVMGASDDKSWFGLEVGLVRRGKRMGVAPNQICVAGLHATDNALLFGDADAFSDINLLDLARELCETLLAPLLKGQKPHNNRVRVYPAIKALPSLQLLSYLDYKKSV